MASIALLRRPDRRTFCVRWRTMWLCLLLAAVESLGAAETATPAGGGRWELPERTMDPSSQARSLAMLSQVVVQLEHYVKSKDLSAIHNEDVILSAAATELLAQADSMKLGKGKDFKAILTNFCSSVSTLHLVSDLNQQAKAQTELIKVRDAFSKIKAQFSKEVVASAQSYLDTFTCPMHRDVVGKRTEFCPKCGMPLDQLARILPANSNFPMPGQSTVRASVTTAEPMTIGQPLSALLHLERSNGDPVSPADLIETHTKKIHLLIVDSSLTDYHHEHPVPTRNPGEYAFNFVPAKPGSYRVWADVRPYPLGLQEYAMTDISATTAGEPLADRSVNLKTTVDGLNYELILPDKAIQLGRPILGKLRITTPDGKGFTQLEPLMATFAHLVGFNQDYRSVMHLHPKGPPITDPAARGGPELEFQIFATQPGFVRLFAQVQIEGRSRFAPFGIQVVR